MESSPVVDCNTSGSSSTRGSGDGRHVVKEVK